MSIFDFSDYDEKKKKQLPSQQAKEQVNTVIEKKKTEGQIFNFSDYKPQQTVKNVSSASATTTPTTQSVQPNFWENVGKTVSNAVQKIGSIFNPPKTTPPVSPNIPLTQNKPVSEQVKNLPLNLNSKNIFDSYEPSATLKPEIQKIAFKNVEPIAKTITDQTEALNNSRKWLEQEIPKANPVRLIAPEQAFAPASEENVKQMIKQYEKTPAYKANVKEEIFTGNLFMGLTGGMIKPIIPKPSSLDETILSGVGNTIGSVYSLNEIGKVVEGFVMGSQTIGQFINTYPKVAKIVIPFIKTAGAFDIYGQLDKDIKNRFTTLLKDIAVAIPFSILGNIKSAKFSIPASVSLGVGLTKLAGGTWEEAIINGAILGTLDTAGRLKGNINQKVTETIGNINQKVTETILKNQALDVLSELSGVRLTNKSTIKNINDAYRKGVTIHHPDKGGDPQNFKALTTAYDFLTFFYKKLIKQTSKQLTTGTNTVEFTPDQLRVQTQSTDLSGTAIGKEMEEVAKIAERKGQSIKIIYNPTEGNIFKDTTPQSKKIGYEFVKPTEIVLQKEEGAIQPIVPKTNGKTTIKETKINTKEIISKALLNSEEDIVNLKDIIPNKVNSFPTKPENAIVKKDVEIPIEQLNFGREDLSKKRLLRISQATTEIKEPISAVFDPNTNQYTIIGDGNHRLATAIINNKNTLKVNEVYIPPEEIKPVIKEKIVQPTGGGGGAKIKGFGTIDFNKGSFKPEPDIKPTGGGGLEALRQEAVKYKSAEEFLNYVKNNILNKTYLDYTNSDKKIISGFDDFWNRSELSQLNNHNEIFKEFFTALKERRMPKLTKIEALEQWVTPITKRGGEMIGKKPYENLTTFSNIKNFYEGKENLIPEKIKSVTKDAVDKLNKLFAEDSINTSDSLISLRVSKPLNVKKGKTIIFKSPFSTSGNSYFSENSSGELWKIEIPKGSNIIKPETILKPSDKTSFLSIYLQKENEIILPPNTKIRIKDIKFENGRKTIMAVAETPSKFQLIDFYNKTNNVQPTGGGGGVVNKNEFYINQLKYDEKGNPVNEFTKVEAKPVETIKGVDTFIHKDLTEKNKWVVSEAKTGMRISDTFKTRVKAINDAKQKIEINKDRIEEAIKNSIKQRGISPRYQELAKGGIIEPNVKPTNQGTGGEPRPRQSTDIIPAREEQEAVRTANTSYTTPAGTADIGGYANIESAEKTVEGIKAVEFPELLRLAQGLTGETPILKKFRRALGRFYSKDKGLIKLNPDIFKDPKLASRVFAHEIGHLADYLPDKTLIRGNILGRIASLNKFLKGTFGDQEINNADIRAELKELSQLWKPFDELQNPNFTSYRFSSKELYADAISVLFNDPALLAEKAPLFKKAFFDNLDSKPEVKDEFNKTWDLLNAGDEAIYQARYEAINKAYEKGEDVWAAKTIEKHKLKTNIFHALRTLFDDKNFELNRRVQKQIKEGAKIEDRLNPQFAFEGLDYADGELKNFIVDNFQPSYIKAGEVDNGWVDLGQILQLERAIFERGELANPGGFDKITAQTQLTQLEKHRNLEDWTKLQEAKNLFREGVQAVVKMAEEHGYYTPDMIDQMKANPAYASFQVIDYLDTYVSAKVHKQVGTLKDIANPATTTVMKAVATMRAIEFNDAKISAIDFQREFYKDELEPAKTVKSEHFQDILDPKDPKLGKVIIIRNGKIEGYYLPKDVSNVLNRSSHESIMMASKISRLLTGARFYRPVFTTINLGFQTFNFTRDFMRYWKNLPDYTYKQALLSFPRAIYRYAQAAPHAFREATNRPDELIKEMENEKILGLTYNDTFVNPNETEEKQIERVLRKLGILETSKKRNLLTPFYKMFEIAEQMGNFLERLPKIAGYIDQKGQMPKAELASFVRKYLGSPAFKVGGTLTPISNNIFLFSNAYKEGIKSDFQIATGYTTSGGYKTRSGFWWKTIISVILPKALMIATALGIFGAIAKKRMDDTSEYDKTNYNILPLGGDKNDKTIYLRIPQDETGRMIGGIFWKLSHFITKEKSGLVDIFNVIDFGAGQVPNLVPSITGMGAVISYLSGNNPYDAFRNRNVIPDTEFKAGFKYSFPIFMDWLVKQQGLGTVLPSYTPQNTELTDLQKLLSAPIISNIIGRWIKVSDQGRTEQNRVITQEISQEKAIKSLDERAILDKSIQEYQKGNQNMTNRFKIEKQLIKDVLGNPPYDSKQTTKANLLIKKFKVALIRGKSDPDINSIISAVTIDEKVELLNNIAKTKSEAEMKTFIKDLYNYKVLSINAIQEYKKEKNKK